MSKRLLMTFVLLFSLMPNLHGQQSRQPAAPSPQPTPMVQQQSAPRDEDQDVVRITTSLVQVDAVVTKDGKQVTDLKAEDFEIFEDGKKQTVTQFSYVSNIPAPSAVAIAAAQPGAQGAPGVPVKVRPGEVRRTVALVIDDLGISAESMYIVKQQLRKFLDKQLQPNDLVAILMTGGSEMGALQQFTTDKRLLSSAVERLRWNPCSRAGGNVFQPVQSIGLGGPGLCSGGTLGGTLQVLRFVLQGMRDLPGRKSMVVFSDSLPIEEQELPTLGLGGTGLGADSRSDQPGIGDQMNAMVSPAAGTTALQRVAELAIRASVVIYAVDTRGLQYTGLQAMDKFPSVPLETGPQATNKFPSLPRDTKNQQMTAVLRRRSAQMTVGREGSRLMARETGGFLVSNSNDFGLQRVMDDQRGYYLIGYRPSNETFNRRFHHIKVRVKDRGLDVRTRKGFYGVTEDAVPALALTARDKMNKALMSPFGENNVNVRLTTVFANHATGGPLLRSFLFLDARDLVFTQLPGGMHEATFDLSSVIFGDYGRVLNRQDERVKLQLRQARYDQVLREGLVYEFDRPVKQFGSFQFRIALHDSASSRIGAASQFIEVPNLRNGRLALSGILVGVAGSADAEFRRGPALRRFQQGSPLDLGYVVYNAVVDKNTQLPQLSTQTRIYRDGQAVYTGKVEPLDVTGQRDLQRIAAGAQLELGQALSPGEYVLQIIVDDHLAKEKQGTVSQWIDFAIVE